VHQAEASCGRLHRRPENTGGYPSLQLCLRIRWDLLCELDTVLGKQRRKGMVSCPIRKIGPCPSPWKFSAFDLIPCNVAICEYEIDVQQPGQKSSGPAAGLRSAANGEGGLGFWGCWVWYSNRNWNRGLLILIEN
jgi:hypothetical protein